MLPCRTQVDETQELAVYAFPTEDGPVEDVIICRWAAVGLLPTPLHYLHRTPACYSAEPGIDHASTPWYNAGAATLTS